MSSSSFRFKTFEIVDAERRRTDDLMSQPVLPTLFAWGCKRFAAETRLKLKFEDVNWALRTNQHGCFKTASSISTTCQIYSRGHLHLLTRESRRDLKKVVWMNSWETQTELDQLIRTWLLKSSVIDRVSSSIRRPVELRSGNAWRVERSCRRPCWGGLCVFGAFSSVQKPYGRVDVSGVQLAELTVWSENCRFLLGRVVFLLIRRLWWTWGGGGLVDGSTL